MLLAVLIAAWAATEAAVAPVDQLAAARRLDRGRAVRDTLALPTGIALLVGEAAAVVRGGEGAALALGAAVFAAGAALRVVAIATLGARFQTAPAPAAPAAALVTTGPYRWMRHPSELGLVAIAAGGAIASASALAAASAIAVAALAAVRCWREDAALARAHPAAHAAWSRTTGWISPVV